VSALRRWRELSFADPGRRKKKEPASLPRKFEGATSSYYNNSPEQRAAWWQALDVAGVRRFERRAELSLMLS
jgi:hypothetical protein